MRHLERARQRARDVRTLLGDEGTSAERLTAHLEERFEVRPQAVGSDFLSGGRGEVAPAEGLLYYDRSLDQKLEEKLELFAHELGHLVLHERLTQALVPGDPLRGSAYLESGAAALARYSRRSQEEAEATAFAAELLAPADELFADWRSRPGVTTVELAAERGVSAGLVRVQLAEGLYRHVMGADVDDGGAGVDVTNPDQEAAATARGTPVLVEAGPGTGKTRTLVRRVVHLVEEHGVAPSQVLVLTFSNEAAEELRARIERQLGAERAAEVAIATFHGFGVHLLVAYGHLVGLGPEPAVIDQSAQEELVEGLLGGTDCDPILDLKDPRATVRRVVELVGYLKDRLITPDRLAEAIAAWPAVGEEREERRRAEALLAVYRAYEEEKRRLERIDFGDLVLLPLELLRGHSEVEDALRREWPWVMVDEYQDVSRSMAMLLQEVCGDANPPWVVGDARQAIYRFRGAAPENVARFGDDFPGALRFEIGRNYRACQDVLDAANLLAAFLEGEDGPPRERWRPGRRVEPLGEEPVVLAEASSDAAERTEVARRVEAWLEAGVAGEEIGVLARRNIDVRNVALELAGRGIRAVTSGLLTSEGAAGDLAAVVTLPDRPRAAAPRLVYALERDATPAVRNEAVARLLAELEVEERERRAKEDEAEKDDDATPPEPVELPAVSPSAEAVAETVRGVKKALEPLAFSGDGWSVLVAFLFDASDYLRRLVAEGADLGAALALEEVVSALGYAARYRFGHPGTPPRASRTRMADRFRELLTGAAPGLVPPRPRPGAVRVMTCHAAKGLEFPCVVVAGQTLNVERRRPDWLPPALRQDPEEDRLQADSLLFVGVTRAERAVVVSHAWTASGTKRSPRRRVPALLERWRAADTVPRLLWEAEAATAEEVTMGPVWGGRHPKTVSLYSVSGQGCELLDYLRSHLGIHLDGVPFPLYPTFLTRVRRAMQRVMETANGRGAPLTADEATAIAAEAWPEDAYSKHPHLRLYRPRALRWVRDLAVAYRPPPSPVDREQALAWEAAGETRPVPLHLLGHYAGADGVPVAIAFRPEPLGEHEALKWSDLADHHRLPLVLAHERDPSVRPLVYSGADGRFYPFRWSTRKPGETNAALAEKARQRFADQASGVFRAEVKDWTCDRCRYRMLCPYWIGAVETNP